MKNGTRLPSALQTTTSRSVPIATGSLTRSSNTLARSRSAGYANISARSERDALFFCGGDQRDTRQTIAARVEEVRFGASFDLKQARPELGKPTFEEAAWTSEMGRLSASQCTEGCAIDLSIGQARQVPQFVNRYRQESGRQMSRQDRADRVRRAGHRQDDAPASQSRSGFGCADAAGKGFDLAQLDAVAPQLHLRVGAPEIIQGSVRRHHSAIAGTVASRRPVDESSGRRLRLLQVAGRDTLAAGDQLSLDSRRQGVAIGIADFDGGTLRRAADRHWPVSVGNCGGRTPNGGLGRSILVEQTHSWRAGAVQAG